MILAWPEQAVQIVKYPLLGFISVHQNMTQSGQSQKKITITASSIFDFFACDMISWEKKKRNNSSRAHVNRPKPKQ